jgi:hypothetical protein
MFRIKQDVTYDPEIPNKTQILKSISLQKKTLGQDGVEFHSKAVS